MYSNLRISLLVFSSVFLSVSLSFWAPGAEARITRIINGTPVNVSEHPWMVALVTKNQPADQGHFCGGSLIAPDMVVTAAHCVEEETTDSFDVITGLTDLRDESQAERIAVRAVQINPEYDTASIRGDFAVLVLERRSSSRPIQFATKSQRLDFPGGTPVTVTGWGNRTTDPEGSDFSPLLNEVDLVVVDENRCNALWDNTLDDNHICALSPDNTPRDSCQGDSGGPLITRQNGTPLLIGVVSFGDVCGSLEVPGVYARVSHFENLIGRSQNQIYAISGSGDFEFGLEARSVSREITVQNVSSVSELVVSDFGVSSTLVSISANTCGNGGIAPGGRCAITVTWTPSRDTNLEANLTLNLFNGSDTQTASVPLQGTVLNEVAFSEVLDNPELQFFSSVDSPLVIDNVEQFLGGASVKVNENAARAVLAALITRDEQLGFAYRGVGGLLTSLNGERVTEYTLDEDWQEDVLAVAANDVLMWSFSANAEGRLRGNLDAVQALGRASDPVTPAQPAQNNTTEQMTPTNNPSPSTATPVQSQPVQSQPASSGGGGGSMHFALILTLLTLVGVRRFVGEL